MALFGKKKPEASKATPQDQALEGLAKYHEKNGNLTQAFYFRNKAVIDLYEQQISDCLVRANGKGKTDAERLQHLYAAKEQFESYRAWCGKQKIGKKYFEEQDRVGPDKASRYERLMGDIAKLESKAK